MADAPTRTGPTQEDLIGYGVQRGRKRELSSVVDDLDDMLDDPLADEDQLRSWKRELELRLDRVEDHVDEIEHGGDAS